jgi:hypothetical protein
MTLDIIYVLYVLDMKNKYMCTVIGKRGTEVYEVNSHLSFLYLFLQLSFEF